MLSIFHHHHYYQLLFTKSTPSKNPESFNGKTNHETRTFNRKQPMRRGVCDHIIVTQLVSNISCIQSIDVQYVSFQQLCMYKYIQYSAVQYSTYIHATLHFLNRGEARWYVVCIYGTEDDTICPRQRTLAVILSAHVILQKHLNVHQRHAFRNDLDLF